MSAAEIIEKIKEMTPEEQREISRFVLDKLESKQGRVTAAPPQVSIRYATDEQARTAGDAVAAEYPETFRRLAE